MCGCAGPRRRAGLRAGTGLRSLELRVIGANHSERFCFPPAITTVERAISGWADDERPRERLLKHGPRTLADTELLAIVVGSGTRTSRGTRTAVSLGRDCVERFGTLRDMAAAEGSDFKAIDGIGAAKAARLVAAFEIGRRAGRKRSGRRTAFRTPEDVYGEYGTALRDLKREIFVVLLLNTSHVRISEFVASEGGLTASVVEPRLVFRRAILEHAACVICLHNHPSGNPEPSREDIAVTRQLVEAGRVIGVPLRDHLIVAGDTFTSLAERGVIK